MKKRYILTIIFFLTTGCHIFAFENNVEPQNILVSYYDQFDNLEKEVLYYGKKKIRKLELVKEVSYYDQKGDITHIAKYFSNVKSKRN